MPATYFKVHFETLDRKESNMRTIYSQTPQFAKPVGAILTTPKIKKTNGKPRLGYHSSPSNYYRKEVLPNRNFTLEAANRKLEKTFMALMNTSASK